MAPRIQSERQRRVESILSNLHSRPSPSECAELAKYLANRSGNDFDYVPAILEPLSWSCVPDEINRQFTNSSQGRERVMLVVTSMIKLSIILQALHEAPSTAQIKAYDNALAHLLLERWETMMVWTVYILGMFFETGGDESGPDHFVRCCANLLLAIVSGAQEDVVKEEISTRKSTIELIYLLLRSKGHHSQPEWHCDVPNAPNQVCKLLELFSACFATPSVAEAMKRILLCTDKHDRRAVVKSLERRGEQMIFGRQGKVGGSNGFRHNPGTLESLFCLIQGARQLVANPVLWKDFYGTRFLHTYAYAIQNISELAEMSKVTDGGCWGTFGECAFMLSQCATRLAPNPRTALVQLMENGFYLCASERFMRYARTEASAKEVLRGLQEITPYLYLYKPYESANLRGEAEKWITQADHCKISRKAAAVRAACTQLLASASSDSDVSICGSILHTSAPGLGVTKAQVCGRCHSIFYCSTHCQQEDWLIHLKECRKLRNLYDAAKRNGSWVSLSVKDDQLSALSRRINIILPPPVRIKSSKAVSQTTLVDGLPSPSCPLTCHQESFLVSFDFFVSDKDKLNGVTLPMDLWILSRDVRACYGLWMARIQQWVDDMETNKETTIIVQGKFQVDSQNVMVVLVRARYCEEAAAGERYTILNSLFSIVPLYLYLEDNGS